MSRRPLSVSPHGDRWDRYVIDPDFLTVEAGGAVLDINGDGNPDIVFGGDWQSSEVWWWENPYPHFDPKLPGNDTSSRRAERRSIMTRRLAIFWERASPNWPFGIKARKSSFWRRFRQP